MIVSSVCLILSTLALGTSGASWKLVWSDEFNGTAVNLDEWTFETGGGGWGNWEDEFYAFNRHENVRLEGGHLVINVKVEEYEGKHFTSARLNSKKGFVYSKFEARAKMPKGKHLWPAIWLFPLSTEYGVWAASGEIDIAEVRGDKPRVNQGSIHYGGTWPYNEYKGSGEKDMGVDLSADFHVYALEWDKKEFRWLFDGKVFHTENIDRMMWSKRGPNPYTKNGQPFDQPFRWILNVAVNGQFFPAAVYGPSVTVDEAKKWEKPTLEIDYVRVYEMK